jgi:diacylglycerol kinase (ATP)
MSDQDAPSSPLPQAGEGLDAAANVAATPCPLPNPPPEGEGANAAPKPIDESPFKGKTGFKRLFNAMGYSLAGFRAAYHFEDAFRQEVLLAAILIPLAMYLGHSGVERALMIAAVLLVLTVELLNSAIEAAVDRISLDHHHLIKRAKDIGSAAVFVALFNVIVVWALVLVG